MSNTEKVFLTFLQFMKMLRTTKMSFERFFRMGVCLLLFYTGAAQAQLVVTVAPVKVAGNKAVVPLAMKNSSGQKIESARAAVFLLNEQGKMVAQGTRWVIGGSEEKPGLAAGVTNAFLFVVTSDKPFTTTNLTAKLSFSRVVLEGGKLADVTKTVTVSAAAK